MTLEHLLAFVKLYCLCRLCCGYEAEKDFPFSEAVPQIGQYCAEVVLRSTRELVFSWKYVKRHRFLKMTLVFRYSLGSAGLRYQCLTQPWSGRAPVAMIGRSFKGKNEFSRPQTAL